MESRPLANLQPGRRSDMVSAQLAIDNAVAQPSPPAKPALPLAARETQTQLVLAARHNRPHARTRLVESHMPLIAGVARAYRHVPCVDRAELMQEGVVGMLCALERYDAARGTPFWAYASWWVRQAMQRLVSELSRPVVLSDRALRQLAHVRESRQTYVLAHFREPSTRELAAASDLTIEQLHSLTVVERRARGLHEQVNPAAGGATFGDLLCDPSAEEAYEQLLTQLEASRLPQMLVRLSARERTVIRARYGLGEAARTLQQLGDALGISAERVRQIEQAALEKMRATPGGGVDEPSGAGLASGVRCQRPRRSGHGHARGERVERRSAGASPRHHRAVRPRAVARAVRRSPDSRAQVSR
jgi:RNA polymerase sigma factor (sigma-70 family)